MAVYRIFSAVSGPGAVASDQLEYTMGMQFTLSQSCSLTGIWFWTASGAGELPKKCAIYAVSGTSIVTGTENDTPSWSGAAGSGWVKCTYNGAVTLAASTSYKVAVNGGGGGNNWYSATAHYWDSGAGSGGLTSGPITAVNNGGGDGGQDTFTQTGSLAYPATSFNAGNYWADVEVTTAAATAGGLLMAGPP